MSWTMVSVACGALASSAVTLAIMAETEPFINEEGEEEYTLSGYLLLTTAYIIKWPFKKLFELISGNKTVRSKQYEEIEEVEVEMVETDNEFELIV